MKHEIDVETRAVVRQVITAIRQKHNVTREVAEQLFQRAIVDSGTVDYILQAVDDDLENQRWMADPNPAE